MKRYNAKHVALSGLLFALAMALSFLESAIAPMLGLMPGVKIGLANIVVMYALFFMSASWALSIAVLKAFFVLLTRGAVAGALSLSGGLLSLLVMWLLYKLPKRPTYFILSVCGALSHNIGQLAAVSLIMQNGLALATAPVLILSGLGMGLVTSASLNAILPAMERMGFSSKKPEKISKKSRKGVDEP